ncbi:hypothetical protein P5673_013041 [Acropora cervicornis]|uniref:Uncharacterized protein n=1 Tax=Acropora cervicornis TaxID=6130 RepID=A0AAD9QL85_ACRCE|nr:hypothetical protein P5673_013041 [Acropora cervicornis]
MKSSHMLILVAVAVFLFAVPKHSSAQLTLESVLQTTDICGCPPVDFHLACGNQIVEPDKCNPLCNRGAVCMTCRCDCSKFVCRKH